ncbi:C-C motif chemokine ligand 14 [Rhinolophus ferrumequinum]|uniref:C-C motif chemokine n=1 Tax=Rhinolophus ferrumequinum TaxID=59479 RepID=A0A671GAD7_RHIFE|nr:C-C motif chemokine 14-like [Rhinolophus ferrumequinum]KAF6298207.1 C-C motif chemokine ligand 14 [Rhinolophus ferrumequinum]
MKVSTAAVSCVLVIIITIPQGSTSEPNPRGPHHTTKCCFTYVNHTIPRQRITDYYETSSQCSKPGVVFITKKGYSICANPSEAWVQDYIKELQEL